MISGAVVMSQTVSLVPADTDPAADAFTNAVSLSWVGSSTTAPTTASTAPEPAALAVAHDPAHEVQALAKGVALAEERARPAPEAAGGPITDIIEDVLG
ncbi:MAG: hypothetical protein LC799_04645, partial [Actinobacteria bacterium]|nr:hypothetical protein [Actinomycetota bacterium]